MIEKASTISNPLTIVAIFAMLAEVFGTVTIGFMAPEVQSVFVWFLIGFPTLLLVLFFGTLNLNRAALYAPTDYRDETNWMSALPGRAVDAQLAAIDTKIVDLQAALADKAVSPDEKVLEVVAQLSELQTQVNILQSTARDQYVAPQVNALSSRILGAARDVNVGNVVLDALNKGPLNVNALSARTGLPVEAVAQALRTLYETGVVRRHEIGPDVVFMRKKASADWKRPEQPVES